MFLSREIVLKLCQIYTKIIYMQFCIKVVVLNRSYSANTQPIWKWLNTSKPENLRFAPLIFFLFCIFNRFNCTYSPYSPYYVTITSSNGSAVYWSRDTDRNRRKPEILRLLWDIIVFRLVEYMLNMIC